MSTKRILRSNGSIRDWVLSACGDSCPICLDYFNKPVVTNCGHVFCSICLEHYMKQKIEIFHELGFGIIRRVSRQMLCPLCKTLLEKSLFLNLNFFTESSTRRQRKNCDIGAKSKM